MIRHILLPIDLTDPSENMILNAIHLCQKTTAKLSLLHVYKLPQPIPVNGPNAGATPVEPYDHYADAEMMAQEKAIVDRSVKKLVNRLPEINEIDTEIVTAAGLLVEQISDFATQNDVDLILMETSGASGMKEIFIGTHSEETSRKAPCPVLIFPENNTTFSIDRICIAADNSIEEDGDGKLSTLKDLASIYNAQIHIIHIDNKPETEVDHDKLQGALGNVFADIPFSFNIIKSEDVEQSIYDFTENNSVDLLVLVYHKHNLFNRIFKKSVTTNAAYHTDVPLLVLK